MASMHLREIVACEGTADQRAERLSACLNDSDSSCNSSTTLTASGANMPL